MHHAQETQSSDRRTRDAEKFHRDCVPFASCRLNEREKRLVKLSRAKWSMLTLRA